MTRMQQAKARKGPGPWFLRFRAMGSWLRVLAVVVAGVFGGASSTAWAGFSLLESNDTVVDTLPLIRVDGEEIEGSVRVRDFGEVTLIPRLEGGSHYYTLDGSEPSTSSSRYTGLFKVDRSAVIRQLSLSASGSEQATVLAVSVEVVGYDLKYQTAGESSDTVVDTLPLIRVDGEEIEGSVRVRDFGEVTLIPRLEGGSHYYTLDGSEPSSLSSRYTGPFKVSQSAVIRQLSLSASGSEQATVRAVSVEVVGYDLKYQSGAESNDTWVDSFPPLIANTIEVEQSARLGDQAQIQLVSRFVGGLIFYTLDGSEPTPASAQYRDPFLVDRTVVVRQLGMSEDFSESVSVAATGVEIVPTYTLTTQVMGSGRIDRSAKGERYLQDAVETVTAVPSEGWRFLRWEGDLSGAVAQRNLVLSRNKSVRSVFEVIPQYMLTTVVGGGTVSGGGVQYQAVPVKLEATPAVGWSFLGWAGDYAGSETNFTWVVEGPATFVANFGTTVSTVQPVGGQIILDPSLPVYPYGSLVRVIPVPNPGFALSVWGGAGAGQPKSEWILKVTNATPKITALFQALATDKAVLTAQSTLGGRVTQSAVDGIYTKGTSVILTPVAEIGYEFTGWSGDASGAANPLSVVVDANKTVKAEFRKVGVLSHRVTVAISGAGTVRRVPDLAAYEAGSVVELVAEPTGTSQFAGWTGAVTHAQKRVRVSVTGPVSLVATFKAVYPVVTEVRGEGQVLLSPPEASYLEGTSVALTAKAADGWGFVQWSGDIVTTTQEAGLTVDGPKRVIAEFARLGTLTTKVLGSGSITRTPAGQSFLPGTAVTLTAQAQAGWRFLKWSGGASGANVTTSVVVGRTEAIVAEFTDGEAPVLSVTQPVSGTVVESLFSLTGAASDAVGLKTVSWAWNGVSMGDLNLTAGGGFSAANLNLAIGTNRIEITATDAAGNAMTVSREVVWSPIRTLIAGSATEVQEGQRMTFPLSLVSSGDVGGLTFKLNYNSAFLTDPKMEWSALVGQSINSINTAVDGEILGAFSLPGTALPTGTLAIGSVSFRARSVPVVTNVVLKPVIVSVGSPTGTLLSNGNGASSGEGRIRLRRIKGDNNANQRIDIGDATVISRLQVGLEEMRAWDVGLNDLNGTSTLDNGDVIKALRIVVGMDVQPGPMGTAKRLFGAVAMEPTPMSTHYSAELALLDGPAIQIGRPYRVAVTLKAGRGDLTGLSFSLRYPASLELKEKAIAAGVPTDALPAWNVSGNRAKLAVIRPKAWAAHSGTVAVFTFEAKPEAAKQLTLPIRLEDLEVADVGEGLSAIPSVWLEIGGGLTAAPELRVRRVEGEALSLEVVGGEGLPMVLEGSVDMTAWTETQRLTGQGTGTPVKVTLQPDPNVQAKFWRVRVR